jgi:hypothetical protein
MDLPTEMGIIPCTAYLYEHLILLISVSLTMSELVVIAVVEQIHLGLTVR